MPLTGWAEQGTIAVIYPEIRQPYKGVFLDIIDGIKQQTSYKVLPYSIAEANNPETLKSWFDAQNIDLVIALGRRGINASRVLEQDVPIIHSASLLPPHQDKDSIPGISLAVDPDMLFSKLVSLAPDIKRVYVIYNPEQNEWLISRAEKSATKHKLELIAYKATNIRAAAQLYQKIFEQTNPGQDALWLPQDKTTVNSRVILNILLKEAWDKYAVMFSSHATHAKNGALFSLFPDNVGLGNSLAKMAEKIIRNSAASDRNIIPLSDVKMAVNIRTADHLNLNIDEKLNTFDLIFPSKKD